MSSLRREGDAAAEGGGEGAPMKRPGLLRPMHLPPSHWYRSLCKRLHTGMVAEKVAFVDVAEAAWTDSHSAWLPAAVSLEVN